MPFKVGPVIFQNELTWSPETYLRMRCACIDRYDNHGAKISQGTPLAPPFLAWEKPVVSFSEVPMGCDSTMIDHCLLD